MRDALPDPRIIRTRSLLQSALMQLAAQKCFAALTVQEVTVLAGLNRTTFYLHYCSLRELLEDCAMMLFSQMRSAIYANGPINSGAGSAGLVPYVESVFHHLEQHAAFYKAMLGRQGDPLFRVLFQELLSELLFKPVPSRTHGESPDPQIDMTLKFLTAGFTGIAAWWLEKEMPITAHQASVQITRDILPDYLRLIENRNGV